MLIFYRVYLCSYIFLSELEKKNHEPKLEYSLVDLFLKFWNVLANKWYYSGAKKLIYRYFTVKRISESKRKNMEIHQNLIELYKI